MQRVAVIGSPGAGKSTLARRLAAVTGLPLIHLDREFWRPGWVSPPMDEWRATEAKLLEAPRWIADGHFHATLELRLERADTVLFLDLPRATCLARWLRRVATHHGRVRMDMAHGCPEHWDLPFLRWIWRFPRHVRPGILTALAALPTGRQAIALRSPREIDAFLADVKARRA